MLNCFIMFYGVSGNMVSSKNFIQMSNYFKEKNYCHKNVAKLFYQ